MIFPWLLLTDINDLLSSAISIVNTRIAACQVTFKIWYDIMYNSPFMEFVLRNPSWKAIQENSVPQKFITVR